MPRDLIERWRVDGTLVARTAVHVGGMAGDPDTDLPLALDGANRWSVPGTSLAGAFRAWWDAAFGLTATECLWGMAPKKAAGPDEGWASFILVADAPLDVPGGAVELRDGVGIDRNHGTAADRIKHDRAVLPAGTTLALSITIEVALEDDRARIEAMLAHFLDALIDGRIPLGAARTRGLGRVALKADGLCIRRQALKDRTGILETLRTGGARLALDALNRDGATPLPQRRLRMKLAWRPLGPIMSRAAIEGLTVDVLPLVGREGETIRPLLTGAGVKGVLRAQAERIVRTLLDLPPSAGGFLDQVRVPLVRALFGDTGEPADLRLGRGALSVEDCYADWKTDAAGWQAIAATGQAAGWKPAHHVAIDRWTGGAADGLLFSVLEPQDLAWRPILIELDLGRLDQKEMLAAVSLLLLVLDDLAAGRLPLGFAGNRGMGALAVERIDTDTGAVSPDDTDALVKAVLGSLNGMTLNGGVLRHIAKEHHDRLRPAWQRWIEGAAAQRGEA